MVDGNPAGIRQLKLDTQIIKHSIGWVYGYVLAERHCEVGEDLIISTEKNERQYQIQMH